MFLRPFENRQFKKKDKCFSYQYRVTYKYRVSQKSFPLSNKVITQDVFSLETKFIYFWKAATHSYLAG